MLLTKTTWTFLFLKIPFSVLYPIQWHLTVKMYYWKVAVQPHKKLPFLLATIFGSVLSLIYGLLDFPIGMLSNWVGFFKSVKKKKSYRKIRMEAIIKLKRAAQEAGEKYSRRFCYNIMNVSNSLWPTHFLCGWVVWRLGLLWLVGQPGSEEMGKCRVKEMTLSVPVFSITLCRNAHRSIKMCVMSSLSQQRRTTVLPQKGLIGWLLILLRLKGKEFPQLVHPLVGAVSRLVCWVMEPPMWGNTTLALCCWSAEPWEGREPDRELQVCFQTSFEHLGSSGAKNFF